MIFRYLPQKDPLGLSGDKLNQRNNESSVGFRALVGELSAISSRQTLVSSTFLKTCSARTLRLVKCDLPRRSVEALMERVL